MSIDHIFHPNRLDKILAVRRAHDFIPDLTDDSSMFDFLTREEAMKALHETDKNYQSESINDWAQRNKMKVSSRIFSLISMKECRKARRHEDPVPYEHDSLDHWEFFIDLDGCSKAITAHLYGGNAIDRARIYAQRNGLALHVPPFPKSSWHNPSECTFVVYTSLGTKISWLPEHLHGPEEK